MEAAPERLRLEIRNLSVLCRQTQQAGEVGCGLLGTGLAKGLGELLGSAVEGVVHLNVGKPAKQLRVGPVGVAAAVREAPSLEPTAIL
jgi:hypothetical protein